MRKIDYKAAIKESLEELLAREKEQKQARMRDRVRFIRYLKEGQASTQSAAGALIGLQRRQSQQLWQKYSRQGLAGLVSNNYQGSWAKLSSTQQARLLQRLDKDDIATQGQLIDWLQQEMGITYSQPGISMLLARLKVKLKTGRPVNVRKDEAGEAAFKKTFLS
ncbi:MAG: winged helix-turn-helix domain-containing protein [Bacteroidota bacterium]|nr:winged helix-turn-helix domain-containing protein [Bacteroidota bacterium]